MTLEEQELAATLVRIFENVVLAEEKSIQKGYFSDLSIAEMHTLDAIGPYESRTMTETAADLGITTGTLTVSIDRLVKKGYVNRKRDEKDRRVVRISLTRNGKLAARLHGKFHAVLARHILEPYSEEEKEMILRMVREVDGYMESQVERYNNAQSAKQEQGMNDIILLKIGEIILKGLNRRRFEQRLLGNIRWRLSRIGKFRVYILQSTIYVEGQEDADMDAAFEEMQKVFGIVSISRASACEKDRDAIAKLAIEKMCGEMARAKSFKVESKRSDKSFPMTSIELSRYVGGELNQAYPDVAVDVHNPELTVYVEVRDLAAYVHGAPVPGAGGEERPSSAHGTSSVAA